MRAMISGAKPGPSSVIVTATASSPQSASTDDAVAREIDRVFQQIAESVEDRRIARADRFGRCASAGDGDVDGDAEIAMRRDHFLDQRGQPHAVERLAARRQFGELGENVAAARAPARAAAGRRRRAAQSAAIALSSSLAITEMVESGVPSSCAAAAAKSVELRKMLLAREHQFGRGERIGQLPRLLGDLPGIDADEADREQDRTARRRSCRSAAIAADRRCPTAADSARTPAPSRRRPRRRRAAA